MLRCLQYWLAVPFHGSTGVPLSFVPLTTTAPAALVPTTLLGASATVATTRVGSAPARRVAAALTRGRSARLRNLLQEPPNGIFAQVCQRHGADGRHATEIVGV
ncbi:MAG: hypothetical protein ACYTHJ_13800 [Planctomycetota bacterium]|jgi:hypothetical protein